MLRIINKLLKKCEKQGEQKPALSNYAESLINQQFKKISNDMDYEKKYKEVLERARIWQKHLYDTNDRDYADELNYIFPELKETEDEKIRKAILNYFIKCWGNCKGEIYGIHAEDAIAWLEKQGEQKIDPDTLIQQRMDALADIVAEQKPADKVEPKFHEGEWIIHHGTENFYQIVAVIDNQYQLKYGDNYTTQYCEDVDRCARLWDITKDAKDGDVLVNQNGEMPFIFKECKNNHIYCYCGYTNRKDIFFNRFVDSEGEELHWLNLYHEQAYPATKEQRELLFKKMHEAGYTFDFDKKELEKIEQKPAWSEEDERILDALITSLNNEVFARRLKTLKGIGVSSVINWLKSIKHS